jgi:Fic family protein
MDVKEIKNALIEQRKMNLSGNLYHRTQVEFAYNTNHIEGSTITQNETESIFETGTILVDKEKVIIIKDVTETKNHFNLFKYMLDTIEEELTEEMIKKYHFILKEGTITEKEKEWFNIGEYKKLKNYVGNLETAEPKDVAQKVKELMEWYNELQNKTFENIIEFHVRFEKIHPFQDGNGRVGRIIMFRECLKNSIIPFYIEDRNKEFYIRGLREYQVNNEKGYLLDTCLNSQDNYEKMCKYFLERKD